MSQAAPLALTECTRAFLSARWERLCLFNYPVPAEILAPHLPPGLELDRFEGEPYVSLVAFDFRETRVLGIPWPGFRNFPEINLRFYVRHGERRGVAFIRELVPNPLVAWIARTLYNEPYRSVRMTSRHEFGKGALTVEHEVSERGVSHTISVCAALDADEPGTDVRAEFFKEHSWGFGISRRGRLLRYEVRHPVWRTHAVASYKLKWDFGTIYGEKWRFLNGTEPASVYLAEGSDILVSPELRGKEVAA